MLSKFSPIRNNDWQKLEQYFVIPNMDEECLATIISNSSERFINDNKLGVGLFQWQQSCSAFSVSKRHISKVCNYIENQKEHHTKESYAEEYENFRKFYQQTIKKAR